DGNGGLVFDKFASLAQKLPHENFRIIFWSSNGHNTGNFVNGIFLVPFVVKKSALGTTFALAKKSLGGSTQPYIGFAAIQSVWLKSNPILYFMTDGQFDSQIKAQFQRALVQNTSRLVIISVENVRRNMNDLEEVNR